MTVACYVATGEMGSLFQIEIGAEKVYDNSLMSLKISASLFILQVYCDISRGNDPSKLIVLIELDGWKPHVRNENEKSPKVFPYSAGGSSLNRAPCKILISP